MPNDTPNNWTYEPKEGEISNYDLEQINNGLMYPNSKAIRKMATELRKWRGEPEPDGQ